MININNNQYISKTTTAHFRINNEKKRSRMNENKTEKILMEKTENKIEKITMKEENENKIEKTIKQENKIKEDKNKIEKIKMCEQYSFKEDYKIVEKKMSNLDKNIVFITFGGGSQNYIDAGKRLIQQAESVNLFNKIIFYTDKYLFEDKEYWEKNGDFVMNNKRGFGYWLWKSYLIKKTISNMKNDEILLYLDCGCEIDHKKRDSMINCINIVKNDYIIGNYNGIEKHLNKMDLIHYLNMNNEKYLNSLQHEAGQIMLLVNDKTRKLVNEWYEIACNYHLLDDSPSVLQNCEKFFEHRHDQAIFSLLTKKYEIFSKNTLSNAFNYSRNRTGQSKI